MAGMLADGLQLRLWLQPDRGNVKQMLLQKALTITGGSAISLEGKT